MGILIGLFVLVFIAAPITAGLLGFGLFAVERKARASAAANKPQIIGQLFGPGASVVSYDSRRANALEPNDVIAGALRNGYELVSNDRGQLLFKRGADIRPARKVTSTRQPAVRTGQWKQLQPSSPDKSTK